MNSRPLLILAVLGFLVGVCFEFLTDSNTVNSKGLYERARHQKVNWDFNNLTASNIKPSEAKYKPVFEEDEKSTTTADIKKKAVATDGKADKKEKKKKKKPKGEDLQPPLQFANKRVTDDENSQSSARPSGGGGGSLLSRSLNDPQSKQRSTAAQWLAYLIEKPDDYDRFLEFVRAYQSREINESVFYAVVEALAVEPLTQLQRYAILALISTPSASSFRQLIEFQYSQRLSTALQEQARSALSEYTTQSNLGMMMGFLNTSEDPVVTLEALNQIQRMVSFGQISFRAGRSARDFDRRNRSSLTTAAGLRQLRTTLNNLARNSNARADIRSAANSLLNIVPVPPTQVPRPTTPTT